MPCFVCKKKIALAELMSVAKCKGCFQLFCSQHRGQIHEETCADFKNFVETKKTQFNNSLLDSKTKPTKLDNV
jgi:hypothetical protein